MFKVFFAVLTLLSFQSEAMLLPVLKGSEKIVNVQVAEKLSGPLIWGGIGLLFFVGEIGTLSILIGGVLDKDSTDPSQVHVDPVKHLEELKAAGVYSTVEAETIKKDIQSLASHDVCELGCSVEAQNCSVTLAQLQATFQLSELTMSYLSSLQGVQN